MAATIRDVAAHCGIEATTVRHILGNGLDTLDPRAIEAVLKSARELGFSSLSSVARLGILYADESGRGLTHPFFSPILNAIREEASARGYDISFISHHNFDPARCQRMDGVCLVCVDYASPEIKAVIDSGIPCVTVDHLFRGTPAVLSDNETGVRRLVEYAIQRGHRRIAFIHGHNNSVVTKARIRQFMNTMDYYKLPVPEEYVREGRYDDVILTRDLVSELLRLPTRPTCILLPDDISYLGAQEAARGMGMDIPGDISFAGYDGISLIQKLEPRLTTIHQDCEKIGRTAVRLLIDLIENPATAKRKPFIFPVEFMPGGTIADVNFGLSVES